MVQCRRILAPRRDRSHVLLACAHYPAISPMPAGCLPERVELVDPMEAVEEEVLGFAELPAREAEQFDLFFTTGDVEAMRRATWN